MTAPGHALLVSHKHPYPTDDGKKAVLAGFVAYLCERFGAANVTYVVLGQRPAGAMAALPCETVWIAPPGRVAQAGHALAALAGLSALSLQEALTRSGRVARELAALVAERRPSLVLLDTIRVGQYFEQAVPGGPRRVLYMDDLFHLRFARLAAMAAGSAAAGRVAPAGTFAPMLPGPARALLAWAPLRDALYRLETRKVEQRELRAPACFDACLLINPDEAAMLRQRGGPGANRVQAVRPLLMEAPPPPRAFTGEPVFVMFGSLRHPVHRASVLRFVGPEGDAVFAALPGLRLVVAGDGADDEVTAACRARPGVELPGFVDDIAPLFARACALLVPSLAGGGLRLKALTAMRHHLPVVATAAGIEGLPLHDGQSVLLAEQPADFVAPMRRLLDPAFNRALGDAAAAVFEQEFGWARVFAELDRHCGVATPQPAPLPLDSLA